MASGKQLDFLIGSLHDSSDNLLTSGTVEFYEAGTSTAVTVYSDETLLSSLGTSITIDSLGGKLVFVDGTVKIKAIIKDSDGNVLRTMDGLGYTEAESSIVTADPEFLLHNTTHEDSDGGRESDIRWKGEQSGGEITTLGILRISHDGASDDEKGKMQIYLNDGNDADSPTLVGTIDSAGLMTWVNDMTVTGSMTVNGTTTTISTTNLLVEDKLVTLNDGGGAGSGGGTGIEVEENDAISGYIKVASDRNGWEFKAPNNASILTIDATATKTFTIAGSLGVEADSLINQDLTTDSATVAFARLDIDNLRLDGNVLSSTSGDIQLTSAGTGVGIGIASPDGTLHVHTATAGAITAKATADDLVVEVGASGGISILTPKAEAGVIAFGNPTDGNDDGQIKYANSTRVMTFTTASTDAMIIDASQNVGIGTASPTATFEVNSGIVNTTAQFISTDAGANIAFADNTTTLNGGFGTVAIGATGDELLLYTSDTEQVRIDSSGNVGIGTASADTKLHVWESTAGAVAALGNTVITAERAGDCNISILTPAADIGSLVFGIFGNNNAASLSYDGAQDLLNVNIAGAPAMSFNNTQRVSLSGGGATINEFSTDGTMAGNSDIAVPTEKAVVTYAVTKTGTPLDNQLAVWTDAKTVEGSSQLTFASNKLSVFHTDASATAFEAQAGHNTFTGNVAQLYCYRASSSAFQFLACVADTDGSPSTIFAVRGDGVLISNGSAGLASFSGAVTNLTVVNGIVTAAS